VADIVMRGMPLKVARKALEYRSKPRQGIIWGKYRAELANLAYRKTQFEP
jgi:hypothetical protein